jgi:hypothetical protein
MLVRFHQKVDWLKVRLVVTRRVARRVRHEHVASLGAITLPPSVADRLAFWRGLHERLAKLSHRVDAETHAKILTAIHARVPIVTAAEQRTISLETPRPTSLSVHDMDPSTVRDNKGLIATAERPRRKRRNRKTEQRLLNTVRAD